MEESETERSFISRTFSKADDETSERSLLQRIPKRFIVSFMAFLGFANVYALRVNLSVAVVSMTTPHIHIINGTRVSVTDFDWTPQMKGIILSSFFWGYIFTQLPGGWLATKLSAKTVFGAGCLSTAVLTLITPPVARVSTGLLVALRVFEGFCEGVVYPSVHVLWSHWAPPLERTKLATFSFSGAHFGTVLAFPLSGVIAAKFGWPWIFYIFGLLGIAWYIAWTLLVEDYPQQNENISSKELDYIQNSIGVSAYTKFSIPWRSILISPTVWAIVVAHFSENWGFYTLLTGLPTFLKEVMQFNIQESGFLSGVPYLVLFIFIPIGGQLADFLRRRQLLSTTYVRKVSTCTGFLVQMIFMIVTAYTRDPTAAVVYLSISVGLGGLSWSGFGVNHLDIAPQFAGVLMGLSNTFATIPGIISPYLTGYLTQDKTAHEWQVVFYISSAIYLLGVVVYGFFASGEHQSWSKNVDGYETRLEDEPLH